jgi:hypothetical protein
VTSRAHVVSAKTEASAAEMKAKAMKASDGERNAVQEVHKLSDKLSRLQMKFTNAEHNLSVATKQKETVNYGMSEYMYSCYKDRETQKGNEIHSLL